MMKLSTEHIDSDSAERSPSDDEKRVGVDQGKLETLGHGQLLPDQDAHLSTEERAAIVCTTHNRPPSSLILRVPMADYPHQGPQASPETRPPPGNFRSSSSEELTLMLLDSLVMPPLLNFLLRSNQHRQCQA